MLGRWNDLATTKPDCAQQLCDISAVLSMKWLTNNWVRTPSTLIDDTVLAEPIETARTGLEPGPGGESPPSRTTQRAAARQNAAALQDAADHVATGVDLIDELDVVDGVENCLADHGEAAIAQPA